MRAPSLPTVIVTRPRGFDSHVLSSALAAVEAKAAMMHAHIKVDLISVTSLDECPLRHPNDIVYL
jgi:hypothetical protein